MTDPQNDPNTPLEDVNPVPLEEQSGEGEQPPDSWGQEGQGNDAEDAQETQQQDETNSGVGEADQSGE